MNIRDRILNLIESDAKEVFLLTLGHRLGISAREVFVSRDAQAMRRAQACNEIMIVILAQVWAIKDFEMSAYPDDQFLAVLIEKADMGDARYILRKAIESALCSFDEDASSE